MDTFTASNGITLKLAESGHIMVPPIATGLGEDTQQALRELFRAVEDKRFGRWRYPDEDFMVVYPADDSLHVVDERDGDSVTLNRRNRRNGPPLNRFHAAAGAWLDAHPEPQPWHDAQPGEVWRFKSVDDWHALGWVANDGTWRVIDPRGEASKGLSDPIEALLERNFSSFEKPGLIAQRLVAEEAD